MRKGLTEIVLVLDRSGSMQSIKGDAEGGMRAFVHGQRNVSGEARLTFYRFDDTIERVFEARDIRFVEDADLRLEPRGGTALLDAIGRAINEVGARLANLREEDRPEHVIVVTVTDGEENASREFIARRTELLYPTQYSQARPWSMPNFDTRPAIFDMIKTQENTYNWKFIFIGSTKDSIAMAARMGYNPGLTLSNLPTGRSYGVTYAAVMNNVSNLRNGLGGQSLNFTGPQRSEAVEVDPASLSSSIDPAA